ncbi:MAG: hypothetical protein J7M13_02765, partial [Synergistetes bacterium]|nr:hypothetical protein [Synergistota bacterium]
VLYAKKDDVADTLSSVRYLLKEGKIVVRDGKIVEADSIGRIIRVDTGLDDSALSGEIIDLFDRFYSISFSNYKVENAYLKREEVISCGVSNG